MAEPEACLRKICAFLKVPFEDQMLTWKPGPRSEDGVWAKYWYQRVHASRGWEAPISRNAEAGDVSLDFPELLAEIQPLFRKLQEHITI